MSLALLLAAGVALQAAARSVPQEPERAPPALPENAILEGVAVQAGEALVTLGEFERALKQALEKDPRTSAEGRERQRVEVLRDLWTQRLEEQGGADLGLDPAQIGRISRMNLQAERDKGGLDAYLDDLRQQGKDALTEESSRREEILRYMWEQAAQGKAFAGRRPTQDPDLRPGELRSMYDENKERLAPATIQLRWLIVSSEAAGSAEAARASCEDARQRVQAGEDLALLVMERGAELRDRGGLTPFIAAEAFPEPALREFADQAQIGDLSPVLPLTNPRTGQPDPKLGYQVAQLHDRNEPPIPEFSSPEVQRSLRGFFLRQRQDLILNRARDRLRRNSYSWVSPLLAGPAPAPGR